jgi:two-component system response regulator PfeR
MRAAKILAVDDEPMNVEILARYLESKGHRVTGAGDSEQALAALRAGTFDLVLVDLVLPGRTGLEALPDLSALTRAPLYLMSGQNDAETRRDALLLGAAGFLPKPIDLAVLAEIIGALA